MSYAESLGSIQQLIIPSARTDLIRYYDKKGYKEISRFNFADTEDTTTAEFIKHTGVEMITMQKKPMEYFEFDHNWMNAIRKKIFWKTLKKCSLTFRSCIVSYHYVVLY